MSWQEYIDTTLVGSGHISQATILGVDGSVWATSEGFAVGGEEVERVVGAFSDPGQIRLQGLFLAGNKFLVLRADERSIYARKGNLGACCVRTEQCVLVGIYDSQETQPGDANKTVEELADYLISAGY